LLLFLRSLPAPVRVGGGGRGGAAPPGFDGLYLSSEVPRVQQCGQKKN
jgi:hypothetical protein